MQRPASAYGPSSVQQPQTMPSRGTLFPTAVIPQMHPSRPTTQNVVEAALQYHQRLDKELRQMGLKPSERRLFIQSLRLKPGFNILLLCILVSTIAAASSTRKLPRPFASLRINRTWIDKMAVSIATAAVAVATATAACVSVAAATPIAAAISELSNEDEQSGGDGRGSFADGERNDTTAWPKHLNGELEGPAELALHREIAAAESRRSQYLLAQLTDARAEAAELRAMAADGTRAAADSRLLLQRAEAAQEKERKAWSSRTQATLNELGGLRAMQANAEWQKKKDAHALAAEVQKAHGMISTMDKAVRHA